MIQYPVRVIRAGADMWTTENRAKYNRKTSRYPSDLRDEEWALVEPEMPSPPTGRPDRRRELLNAILYVLTTGCQWRALPKDFPPKSTVHDYFVRLHCDGDLARIHHALYAACREQAERTASPTLAIVDSQSVKAAEKGGRALIRSVTTQAKRSRAGSATPPLIRSA